MPALNFDIRAQRPFNCHYQASFAGHGIHFLWGNSGAGKTTLLHMLAGLIPAEGSIRHGETDWQNNQFSLPARARDISLVFQKDSLFPFLSVSENLLFGFKNAPHKRFLPEQVMGDLGITPLLKKNIRDLSGGERQRVQLGRALLNQPGWLFLDEAFAALDPVNRQHMFGLLRKIADEYQIPVVMISHQWQEVLQLADFIHGVADGRITSSATFAQALASGDFSGRQTAYSVLQFTDVQWCEPMGLFRADMVGQAIWLPQVQAGAGRLVIQARDVAIALVQPQQTSILNAWPAEVVALESLSDHQVCVHLDVAGQRLLSQISAHSAGALKLQPGLPVYALVKGVALLR